MAKAVTNTQHYSDIAMAIRTKTGKTQELRPSEMAAEISSIETAKPEIWQRPNYLPDYSKVNLETQEVLYLTYDTTIVKRKSNFISITVTGSPTTIEWGTLNNGILTVSDSATLDSGGTYRASLPTNLGRYVVYRIKPSGTTHITRWYLNSSEPTIANQRITAFKQPLIEVYCRLPYVNHLGGYMASCHTISYAQYGACNPTSMSSAFAYSYAIERIYFEDLDTQNCTTFVSAFRNCNRLKYMDFDLTVTNKCTSLQTMFYCLREIENFPFDFASWDTSKVTSFADMFNGCCSVEDLNVQSWDVSSATSFSSTFASCMRVRDIDVTRWVAPKCTTVYSMFSGCHNLEEIDISNLGTDLITTVRYFAYNCGSLLKVDVSNLVTNKCTDMRNAFASDVRVVEIIGLDTWDTSSIDNAAECFYNMNCISELDLQALDLSGITKVAQTANFLRYATELEVLTLPPTLNYLGQYFISNANHIREYHFLNPTPATLYNATLFPKYIGMKMYVPVGSLNAYKSAWSGYVDYLVEEGT